MIDNWGETAASAAGSAAARTREAVPAEESSGRHVLSEAVVTGRGGILEGGSYLEYDSPCCVYSRARIAILLQSSFTYARVYFRFGPNKKIPCT